MTYTFFPRFAKKGCMGKACASVASCGIPAHKLLCQRCAAAGASGVGGSELPAAVQTAKLRIMTNVFMIAWFVDHAADLRRAHFSVVFYPVKPKMRIFSIKSLFSPKKYFGNTYSCVHDRWKH